MHTELPPIMRILGIAAGLLFFTMTLFNAVVMLIFPEQWFNLPGYLGFQGTIRKSMLSTLSGRIQIRAAGLVMLGFLSCIVTAILTHYLKLANGGGTPSRSVPYVAMCVATCLTASTSGALMLLKPRWWFEKYWASGLFDEQQRRTLLSIRAIRIVGALFFVGGVYMAWLSL